MQLRLTRSQKTSGMMSKSVVFILTAQAILSEEEKLNVDKYKLGNQAIYNSETSRKHLDKGQDALSSGSGGGLVRGMASLALSKMSLNITVESLTRGQTVECKSLDEVLGAEEAVRDACQSLVEYISVASAFNGSEEIIEFQAG